MSTLIETGLLLLGGATGTEVVRFALNFRKDKRKDEREGEQLEFQQIADLGKQAAELREEMRRNNSELRTELSQMRGELESWRRSYFDLFHTAREIQQQYGLVTTYLNAILAWLKHQNIDIPMPVPVMPELPPLPSPPPGIGLGSTAPAARPGGT
jgi:vacuolar-type H+-ATPase subunit I/STV1